MPSTSQLNIKNPETRRLASELARLTGESVTEAVTAALKERLDRINTPKSREGIAEKLLEIGRRAAARPVLDSRHPDDILYNEFGLPK
ncbi:MAG: type II toxin-antitoxin system VapB family antitoxin [Rhizobiales bacterium]|nr:type II toxin-antitoxin system VapB family antitoxin [Hyphomicrobiales bacterium]